jgi:hypothetical protein
MGFYEISPLVNFNITEFFQVRVNSLDYKGQQKNITESF